MKSVRRNREDIKKLKGYDEEGARFMKKYRRIIALCACLSCFSSAMMGGSYSFAGSNLQLLATQAMPDAAIAHYEANSFNDFLIWLRNSSENKESFKEFIAYWTGAKNYLVPDFCGGKLNKIFADSNQNFITFLFDEPHVKVTYECFDNTNGSTDIFSYMESKYNVEYDKMINLDVYDSPLDYNNGYEYNKHMYTKEKIVMKNYSADCVCETSYSEKSDTCYNIAFLYNNMLVRLICYTEPDKTLDKNIFANLSLVCVNGSPLFIDPPTGEPTAEHTTKPAVEPMINPIATSTDSGITLKSQTITTVKIKSYKAKLLKKNKITFQLGAISSGKGKLIYKNTTAKNLKKYICVSKKGKVKLKKGAKKGTYKITIAAAKTGEYKETKKVVSIKVK